MDKTTMVNIYPKAGTDADGRRAREDLFTNTLPNMPKYTKDNLIIGGDWNCITDPKDCTYYANQRLSPILIRLLNIFHLKDTFRLMEANKIEFSRNNNNKQDDTEHRDSTEHILQRTLSQ